MGTKNHTFLTAAAATVALAGLPTAASAASVGSEPSTGLVNAYDTVYERVQDAGGEPGRNLADDGVRDDGEARPATRGELLSSLRTLRRMHVSLKPGSKTARASLSAPNTGSPALDAAPTTTGAASTASASDAPAGAPAPATGGAGGAPSSAGSGLESVAQCESGGDPGAVSADGQYRGKYQFDQQTWNSVGGSGDPAAAPEAEQDQRAAQLQAQRGSSPWPVCG